MNSTMETPSTQIKLVKKIKMDKSELEEVAKIKFEHHQVKRLRKLAAISNLIDK